MIHTFSIYYVIPGGIAHQILRHLGVRQHRRRFKGNSKVLGLTDISIAPRGSECNYWLKVKVNPAKLLYGAEAYGTVDVCELPQIVSAFDRAVRKVFGCTVLPLLPDWYVQRIDYAVDIRTDYVDNYLKLFDKADRPKFYKEEYNSEQGSCYWKCKSATINVYNKADKLRKDGYSQQIVDSAKDILRIEIQCKSPKVRSIKKKRDFDERKLQHFFCREIASDILCSYCRRVYKPGDYYSLSEAKKLLKLTVKSTKSRNSMINLLKVIAQTRSISEARKQLTNGGVRLKNTIAGTTIQMGKEQFSRKMAQFANLGINPVTIPRSWDISRLTGIMQLVESMLLESNNEEGIA